MKRPVFFDTNIFVYADDASNPAKQAQAIQLLKFYREMDLVMLSIQVMQEYFQTVTRKLHVDPILAQAKVELMARMKVVRLGEQDVLQAIDFHRLYKVSFWDSLILHAARIGGAEVLFTEDLQDGAVLAGVRIENPFRS